MRLALATFASILLHAMVIRHYSWTAQFPDQHRNDLTARIVALPGPAVPFTPSPPVPPATPDTERVELPRKPAPARPVARTPEVLPETQSASASAASPSPSVVAAPARDAAVESRIRGTVRVEIEDEPDELPDIESERITLSEFVPSKSTRRRATFDEQALQVRWPEDVPGERRKFAVPLLVFVDASGEVREALVVEDIAPRPFVEAAVAAVSSLRFEPALAAGGPVASRLLMVFRFGYD